MIASLSYVSLQSRVVMPDIPDIAHELDTVLEP
jgi:hypothetical protein